MNPKNRIKAVEEHRFKSNHKKHSPQSAIQDLKHWNINQNNEETNLELELRASSRVRVLKRSRGDEHDSPAEKEKRGKKYNAREFGN